MTLERIEQSRLTDLTIKALQTYGLSEPDARSTAEILVLADMFGLHTHGVSRVESYGERLELGGIKASAQMKVEKCAPAISKVDGRSEEHTSELQSLMRISYAVFCLKKTTTNQQQL